MSHPFDATVKDILSLEPAELAPAFHLPTTRPAQVLNVDLSTISAATDIAIGYGAPLQEITDLNFQSGPDDAVDARVHLYNAVLHFKYRVPVRSILVLLRPKADYTGLDGKLTYTCGGKRVEFNYDVVRMWEQPPDLFLHGAVGLLPLAPLCKMPDDKPVEESIRDVVREIDRRLASLPDHAHAVRLMTATFVLTGLRLEKQQLRSIFDGVAIMHETTAWDLWEEVAIRQQVKILLRQGRQRFGPSTEDVEAAFASINNLDRLERMSDAVLKATSWNELLKTP